MKNLHLPPTPGACSIKTKVFTGLLLLLVCNMGNPVFAIPPGNTWYNIAGTSVDLSQLSSWGSNPDGTGINPPNFTADATTYMIVNGTAPTVAGNWTVSGIGSSVTVGDGTAPINFTIPDMDTVTATINVNNTDTLTILDAVLPTFGTLSSNSNVVLADVANGYAYAIPSMTYGNFTNASVGSSTVNPGTTTIAGNLTLSGAGITDLGIGMLAVTGNYLQSGLTNMVVANNNPGSYSVSIGGTFTMVDTTEFTMIANSASVTPVSANVTVTGDVNINSAGSEVLNFCIPSAGTSVFQANGNATLTGDPTGFFFVQEPDGSFRFSFGAAGLIIWGDDTSTTSNMFGVKGNLRIGGSNYMTASTAAQPPAIVGQRGFVFNGSGTAAAPQILTYTNSQTNGGDGTSPGTSFEVSPGTYVLLDTVVTLTANNSPYSSFTVDNGGTLDCANISNAITGGEDNNGGGLILNAGGTLATADPAGLSDAIQALGSTYNAGANYIFYGGGSTGTTTITTPWPTSSGSGNANFTAANAPASVTVDTVSVTTNLAFSPSAALIINATGALDMGTFALGGTFTPAVSGMLKTACVTTYPPIPGDHTWGGTVDYYATTGLQGVANGTYNNFTFSSGTYEALNGAMVVNGLLTGTVPGVLDMTTHILGGTPTSAGGGTIQTQVTTSAIPVGITWAQNITYNNTSGGQTIISGTYSGGLTNDAGSGTNTVSGAVSISPNSNLNLLSGTFNDGGTVVTLDGTLSGTAKATGSGAIELTTDASNITGAPILGNLTTGASFSVTGTPTVTGTLALSTFTPSTSSSGSITINGGSVTRNTGYVNGTLSKNISGLTSVEYEVGDVDSATVYFTLAGGTASGYIAVRSNAGLDPNLLSSDIDLTNNVSHYWTISSPGNSASGFSTIDPVFAYNAADIEGGIGNNTGYKAQVWNGTSWNAILSGATDPTSTTTNAGAIPSSPSSGYLGNYSIGLGTIAPPVLTAAVGATVDNPFVVTWTPSVAPGWGSAITSVHIGTTTLTGGYSINTVTGTITFTPSASVPASLLQTSGILGISVLATGFGGATVSQPLGAGTAAQMGISVQPIGPATNGGVLATQPVLILEDQYGNAGATGTVTVTATATGGTWIIGGTTSETSVAGTVTFIDLTAATSPAAPGNASITFSGTGLTPTVSATFTIPAGAHTWYNMAGTSVDLTQLSSWGSNTDGTGSNPSDFTSDSSTFLISNGTTPTIAGNWVVTGAGSNITVGNGTTPVNFIIPGSFSITGTTATVNVAATATLTFNNPGLPTTWGTLAPTSTVIFAGTTGYTIPPATAVTFGNLIYNAIANSKTMGIKTYNIAGSLTVNGGKLTSSSFGSQIINIGGDLAISGTAAVTNNSGFAAAQINFDGTTSFADPQEYTNTSSANSVLAIEVNAGSFLQMESNFATSATKKVAVNGTLDCQANVISGSGTFLLAPAATLATSNSGGISGSLTTSGVITLSPGANYIFYGATGTMWPTPGTFDFVVANAPASVTVTNSITATSNDNFSPATSLMVASGSTLDMSTFALGGLFAPSVNGTLQTQDTNGLPISLDWTSGGAATGTIQYNADAGTQIVVAGTYYNLSVGGTSGIDTAGGNLTVNGTLSTAAGTTLDMGASSVLNGTLSAVSNAGKVTTEVPTGTSATPLPSGKDWSSGGNGTVTYDATGSAQTVAGGSYNNLTLNDGSGLSLNGNAVLTGTLTLTGSILTTGGNFIIVPGASGNVSGTGTSYVKGTLIKTITGLTSIYYEVGDNDSANVSLVLNTAGTGGSIGVSSGSGNGPNIITSGIVASANTGHYWAITSDTATGFTVVTPTFYYNASNITAASHTNAGFVTQVYNGGWGSLLATTNSLSPTYSSPGAILSYTGEYEIGLSKGVISFTGGATQSLFVCENTSSTSIDTLLEVTDTASDEIDTWTVLTGPTHGTLTAAYATTSTGGVLIPIGLTYTPPFGYSGIDSFVVQASNGATSVSTVIHVTVGPTPMAGMITGTDSVCVGETVTLSDIADGGTWSSSNATATVSGSVVTGISVGIDTIIYTVSNSCSTASAIFPIRVQSSVSCNNTGVKAVPAFTGLQVYPNPNNGTFTVNVQSAINEEAHVVITNMVGEKVKEFTLQTNTPTDMQLNAAVGIYFLNVDIDGIHHAVKLMVAE